MPGRLKARMVGTLKLCFFVLVEMEGMVDKLVVVKNLNGFPIILVETLAIIETYIS